MLSPLDHSEVFIPDAMEPNDVTAVLRHARSLQRAAEAGDIHLLLRGKNLALMCEADDQKDAELFRSAAVQLGAHVSHIRPSLSSLTTPEAVQNTARMLGRLYDAMECQGMTPALVRQVGRDAGMPVYDGIASRDHPIARLARRLATSSSLADRRRFVVQAVLLHTMA